MKVQKLAKGATIEVNDRIQVDNWTGKRWYTVVRVTPKFAMVKWNEHSEGKFRREVDHMGYAKEAGNTDLWSTTKYTAWRPVPVTDGAEVKEGETK